MGRLEHHTALLGPALGISLARQGYVFSRMTWWVIRTPFKITHHFNSPEA